MWVCAKSDLGEGDVICSSGLAQLVQLNYMTFDLYLSIFPFAHGGKNTLLLRQKPHFGLGFLMKNYSFTGVRSSYSGDGRQRGHEIVFHFHAV